MQKPRHTKLFSSFINVEFSSCVPTVILKQPAHKETVLRFLTIIPFPTR